MEQYDESSLGVNWDINDIIYSYLWIPRDVKEKELIPKREQKIERGKFSDYIKGFLIEKKTLWNIEYLTFHKILTLIE